MVRATNFFFSSWELDFSFKFDTFEIGREGIGFLEDSYSASGMQIVIQSNLWMDKKGKWNANEWNKIMNVPRIKNCKWNRINMGGQSELKKKEEIRKVKGRGNLCWDEEIGIEVNCEYLERNVFVRFARRNWKDKRFSVRSSWQNRSAWTGKIIHSDILCLFIGSERFTARA